MRLQEKTYPVRLVLKVAGLSSAAWYTASRAKSAKQRPGPKPLIPDAVLLEAIREDLSTSKFHSEGHKKVRARLRRKGIHGGRKRYLRLMKENGLLAPNRPKWNGSSRKHDGVIRTESLNRMWGSDGKQFWTRQDGLCWFFGVIDHCNDEILGWHASNIGNRFAAMEPVHQAVSKQFGSLGRSIAKNTGLVLRRDHGTQYDSKDFRTEMAFLGLEQSPAYVHSPQCNGIIERFNRTLQEQAFDIHNFETIGEARKVIGQFIEDYNHFWIIERLGYHSPIEFKDQLQNNLLKCA